MVKALDLGMTTLEMDVVISADSQVVLSHEPFFSHEISTAPDGHLISKEEELSHNMFLMTYSEIQQYDVGLRAHTRFPDQVKTTAVKPTLEDVVTAVEQERDYRPYYNIEIKRKPAYDSVYHPTLEAYAQLVVDQCRHLGIMDRTTIQSFDVETLQYIHHEYPDIKLAYLIENRNSIVDNLSILGFTPEIYSPYYQVIDEEVLNVCSTKNMQLIPWTVNEIVDMLKLLEMGVDGIITDYPDRLAQVIDNDPAYARIK
jgi:glycerophosphoryl diester phosphodiesterase